MNKTGKFLTLSVFALLLCFSAGSALADDYVYVTTNMTWAEFYAGELGESSSDIAVSYDAVSTATQRFATRFGAFTTTLSGDGTVFEGVKDVQVRMTSEVYGNLADTSRFSAPINGSFDEYKEMDAAGNFGAMVTKTVKATGVSTSISGGKSTGHGNYRIALTGLDYAKLSADLGTSNDKFLGVKLETSDGTVYGMKPLHNLWIRGNMAEQIGFCVEDFSERNGTHLSYAHTKSLPGKTITKITYMLKNQPDIVIECELFVKKWTDAAVKVSGDVGSGTNVAVPLTFTDIPKSADYTLSSVAKVVDRTSTVIDSSDYSYSDNTLIFPTLEGGSYTVTFTSETYVDIVASVTVRPYFATTNMTWAEFYAGELGKTSADLLSAGLDAVSSPTARVANGQTQLTSEANSIGGRNITGVKAVQVHFDKAAYAALSSDKRFTWVNDVFYQYKPVNANGSFGAMVTESKDMSATVTVASGADSTWGSYTLSITGLGDIVLSSGDQLYYLGAVLETESGDKFGLRYNNNLWRDLGTVAITVNDRYVEPHDVTRDYKYTKSLDGQTVKKITFLLKDQPSVVVNCSAYLTPIGSAKISVSNDVYFGVDEPISFKLEDIPDGVIYNLKEIYSGTGRNKTLIPDDTYTYDDGILTMNTPLSLGKYQAIFENDGNYANISVIFEVKDAFYGTTDMTWAEFYAGELGKSSSDLAVSYDVVSTATTRFVTRFGAYNATSSDNGTIFEGVKDVQVKIPLIVYDNLSATEKSRFKTSDSSFTEYKEMSADGSFGAMVTKVVFAKDKLPSMDVAISGGQGTTHGNYRITLTGLNYASLDVALGTNNDRFLGVKLRTSDDVVYGMKPLHNLWIRGDMAEQIGFSVVDFVETSANSKGTRLSYEHTKSLQGKTIKSITYMLKNQSDIVISCDLYVKKWLGDATVSVSGTVGSGKNVAVTLTSRDVPNDAAYSLASVVKVVGRTSTPVTGWTYSGNVLTVPTLEAGSYTATFTSDTYTDLVARFTVQDYFATTNMTWAEFYAGELGKDSADLLAAGLDAVSSSTARIANGQTQLTSESNDIGGRSITGVKAVQVHFDDESFAALSKDERFTFAGEVFEQYKPVKADGSFGAMVTESKDMSSAATVTVASGGNSTWGSYTLSISGLGDVKLTSGDQRYYLGAVLETSDGLKFGLRHNNNLWMNLGTVAITVNDKYVEPKGVTRDYKYTASLEGKTVTKITFIIKNQPSIVVNCNAFLKTMNNSSTVNLSTNAYAGVDVPISFRFDNLPEGTVYDLAALYLGTKRNGTLLTDWTYQDGILTVNGSLPAGKYQAFFETDNYSDLLVNFEVENAYYATIDMTWEEFYSGEIVNTSSDLLDAISSPTSNVANRFTQLTSESNDIGGRSITGVKAVQVRMNEATYQLWSKDERFTFTDEAFTEFKDVNSGRSFGKMVTKTHVQNGAIVTLTSPGTWGDYVLSVTSIDVPVKSGDEYVYLGALVETSDGSVYGMRHNNNLWFNAKDLAISTAEFVEVHGVSRNYKYTSDMEGKTITKITYMLKNLPDEIVSCDVFLKLKTSASVAPVYETGYHAVMEGSNIQIPIEFSNVPSSADYSLSGVTFGTGRNRKTVSGCTMSGNVLTISGDVGEGTYTATFVDKTYANIAATIQVYTTNATDKIISADKNLAQLSFLLTPRGVSDSTDAVLDAQNFVNATEYTKIADNSTSIRNSGLEGSGFSLEVKLNDVPSGKRGIVGFSQMFPITSEKIGSRDFTALSAKILALPDVAYGWRVPSGEQLKDMGLTVVGIYPDGVSRDITGYVSSGLLASTGTIMMSYGTVLIDRAFTPSEEGKVYQLSPEGEGTMSDGRADGNLTATWYVTFKSTQTPSQETPSTPSTPTTPDTPVVPITRVQPSRPSETLTTEAKQSEIREKLGNLSSKVTESTDVSFGIPEEAIIGQQTVTSPDARVAYLPIIEVTEPKVYVFGVSLDNLVPGAPLVWNSNALDTKTGEFVTAADAEEAVTFFDRQGIETTVVPADRFVNVAAYLEPGYRYEPTITSVQDGVTGVSSQSGGCNSQLTLVGAMMMSLLLIYTRRRQ